MDRSFRNRRGVTSVIAMLFMVLIGTLALGFYASVTTATALAKNDRRSAKALMAAESGIQFMRHQLANVTIPPDTTPAQVLGELFNDLKVNDHIVGNLPSGAEVTFDGSNITIPFIATDTSENSGFTVTISDVGAIGEIVCTVKGRSGDETRGAVSHKGVRLDFTRHEIEGNIFDNAVATKGTLIVESGASITGIPTISTDEIIKLVSAKTSSPAISITGGTVGSATGGELGVTMDADADGKADYNSLNYTGGSVHGSSTGSVIYQNHLKLVPPPQFPEVNTDMFATYATNSYSGTTSGVLKNVRIPAGSNPTFDGNVTIQGVLYIESPNTVTFAGNATMQGFLVFQKANTTTSQDVIAASGNFTYGNLPDDAEFDPLRTITGISMLAPTASLRLSGNLDSQIRGNMILGNIRIDGNANMQIEKGSIITMDETGNTAIFSGKKVRFASTGMGYPPSHALTYTSRFLPTKGSYLELN